MKKIVVYFELPELTMQQYDAICKELTAGNNMYSPDRPSHVAFQKGDTCCVVDVWNSEEAFMNFGRNVLFPIFGKLGINPPPPAIFPAHHFVGSMVEEYSNA